MVGDKGRSSNSNLGAPITGPTDPTQRPLENCKASH